MRLLITHNGIMKVFPNATQYQELLSFIHDNFPTVRPNSFALNYLDSDGDMVSLGSQMDLQTMTETISNHYVKVFLKEEDIQDQIQKQEIIQKQKPFNESISLQSQPQQKEQTSASSIDNTPDELEVNKVQEPSSSIIQAPKQSQIHDQKQEGSQAKNWQRCGGFWNKRKWFGQMTEAQCQERKRQWKEKVNEQIAKKVDERIQTLLPMIVKKVQQSLSLPSQSPEKFFSKQIQGDQEIDIQRMIKQQGKKPVSVHKGIRCSFCWTETIVGIRYRCTKCPAFNLCQQCEPKADHNHNMIKMKYQQQDPEVKHHQKPFKLQKMSDCNMRDPKFALTKKCFKLASIYGGQPEQYVAFVNDHLYDPVPALVQKYRQENNVSFSQRMGTKLQNLAKKLGFYFNKKAEEFIHLVQENPNLHFKGLLRKAQEEQEESKLIQEISKIEKEKSEIKMHILKPKVEEVKEELKKQPKEKQGFGIFSIKSVNHNPIKPVVDNQVKKADVILRLKDIFGQQKSWEYLKFYEGHSQYQVDTIVDKYIQTQFK